MPWQVEFLDVFDQWWSTLSDDEQDSVVSAVGLLRERGPTLGRPHVDHIKGSRHQNMKELRIQHRGRPLRVLFAFDPRRTAMLLLGGDKTGDARWYDVHVPLADAAFDRHLRDLERRKPKEK